MRELSIKQARLIMIIFCLSCTNYLTHLLKPIQTILTFSPKPITSTIYSNNPFSSNHPETNDNQSIYEQADTIANLKVNDIGNLRLERPASYFLDNGFSDGDTLFVCEGNFYDAGGPSGNHSGNYIVTFCATGGNRIRADFNSFNITSSIGGLSVYNGYNGIGSPFDSHLKIGDFNNGSSSLPPNWPMVSSDSCLTFRVLGGTGTGWDISLSCEDACTGNLLENPSFDINCDNCSTPNWNTNGNTTQMRFWTKEADGAMAAWVTWGDMWQTETNITGGYQYDLSFYSCVHDITQNQSVSLVSYDGGSILDSVGVDINYVCDTDSTFGAYNLSLLTSATADSIRVIVSSPSTSNTPFYYNKVDKMCLQEIIPPICPELAFHTNDTLLCDGTTMPSLLVGITSDASRPDTIQFSYFTSSASTASIWGNTGISLGEVRTTTQDTAILLTPSLPAHSGGTTNDTLYVYAYWQPRPTDATCQAIDSMQIIIARCDWGDLPDASTGINTLDYQTLYTNNGPVHQIIEGLYLGNSVDQETDGQQSVDALGDGTDDDGTTIFASLDLRPGGLFRLPFSYLNTTGNTAYLAIWIDWNGDGDFLDTGELVTNLNDGNGATPFPSPWVVTIPATAITDTFLGIRMRLSNEEDMTPYGKLDSGEVEDYLIRLACKKQICLPATMTIRRGR